MRARRSGCIGNISSVAGRISNSPLGADSVSTFAVEASSEALAGEVKSFSIRVAVVAPGIQNTRLAQALANPVPPAVTAGVIRHIIESGTWKLRHPSGPDAEPFLVWRSSQSDEQWVDWSAQEDEA